jgi:flagellar basal body-associated protein FliL
MSFYIWLIVLLAVVVLAWFWMSKKKKGGPGIGQSFKQPESHQAPEDQTQQ